jgi:tetratricopeptide (TPR) repeat protein
MGELYLANEQSELALKEWKPLKIGVQGWEPNSSWRLAALLVKQGKQEQSDQLINPVLEIDGIEYPRRDLYLAQIVDAFVEVELPEQALKFARRLSDTQGKQSIAFNRIAQYYLLKGQEEKGLQLLDDANSMILKHIDYVQRYRPASNVPAVDLENNIIGYAMAGKYETALKLVSYYDEINKDQVSQILFRISVSQKALKDREVKLATDMIAQASKLAGKSDFRGNNLVKSQVLKDLSDAYRNIRQPSQSKQLLAEAFDTIMKPVFQGDPDFAEHRGKILYSILTAYTQIGEYEKAKQVAEAELNLQERNRLVQLVQCSSI